MACGRDLWSVRGRPVFRDGGGGGRTMIRRSHLPGLIIESEDPAQWCPAGGWSLVGGRTRSALRARPPRRVPSEPPGLQSLGSDIQPALTIYGCSGSPSAERSCSHRCAKVRGGAGGGGDTPGPLPHDPTRLEAGRGLATRRWRGLEGVAVRDLPDLAKRWSAMSEVDRTATPACTPPCTSATHKGAENLRSPRGSLTLGGRVLRPGGRTGMRAARPPGPLGGSHRSAVRVNVAVQEPRLRGSAERSKPATIRPGCRTDL